MVAITSLRWIMPSRCPDDAMDNLRFAHVFDLFKRETGAFAGANGDQVRSIVITQEPPNQQIAPPVMLQTAIGVSAAFYIPTCCDASTRSEKP